jgi:hypothetical protein
LQLHYFSNNIVDARCHVKKVSLCFNKWCCNALYEDVGMKLFILSFDDDDLDWFTEVKDKHVRIYNELIDAFMGKWKEKKPPNMKTINSDVKNDASPDSNQKFKEFIQAIEFIYAKQLKAMEACLAEAETCIKYLDTIEPELHSEQEREFHLEILEEPVDCPFSTGGQLMCHEEMHHQMPRIVEDLGSTTLCLAQHSFLYLEFPHPCVG